MTTPRLGAPELVSGQAVPETTVNEALYMLDAASLGGFKVIDRDLATPPGSPSEGDCYILSGSGTGAWTGGSAGDIALYVNTAWSLRTPDDGWEAWVVDEAVKVGFSSGSWGIIGTFDGASYVAKTGDAMTGDLIVPAEAYGAGWNGSNEVPTKNDVYDKIEALSASVPGAYTDENARDAIGTALTAGNGISVTVDDAGDTITLKAVGSTVSTQTGTSYTAVLGDANTFIRFTNASAVTFTIPPNSSVAFPTGTVIEMAQAGAGALSVAAGAGVTINSRSSDLTLAGQYAVAFVKKVDTDTWIMNGDL